MRRRPAPSPQSDSTLPPCGALISSHDGTAIYCHVCGAPYKNLAAHALRAHGLAAAEYRETYELARGCALVAPALARRYSTIARAGDFIDHIIASARGRHHGTGRPRGLAARLSERVARSEQLRGRLTGQLPPAARAIAEGRRERLPARPRTGRPRGEMNGRAKLSAVQVAAIRERHMAGNITKRALGREYGVSEVLIGLIVRGKIWRDPAGSCEREER